MARKSNSKELLLDTTADLLRAQGYAATGLNEVVARSGAPKGSLYFHFPGGKEQLADEALERSCALWRANIEAALEQADSVKSGLLLVVEALEKELLESDFQAGCPLATVALETANNDDTPKLKARAEASFAGWISIIEERLGDRTLALFVLSSIEGALMLCRVRRELAPLHAVRDTLSSLL